MSSNKKWSELTKKEKKQAKKQHGSKQGWQDAKAKSLGFKNEQDRRGNSGERHQANNTPSPSPSQPDPAKRYDKKWSELTPQQRERSGSKKEHSEVRTQYGLKGGKKDETYTSPFFNTQTNSDQSTTVTNPGLQDNTTPQTPTYDDSGLQTRFDDLSSDYDDLKSSFDDLKSNYVDSGLQTRFDDLSSNYDDLQSSFDNLKSNFESFMTPEAQQAPQSPMNTGTEQSNPFSNTQNAVSPFATGINSGSVDSYLNNFKGVEITPYQSPSQSSYTSAATLNPTNFTGYNPQVYTPAMHYGTGDDKSVADQQQMYVSEGGQGFYGSPQVIPTNPFTGKPFELDANGLPKLPTNFMYGPGTTISGPIGTE